MSGDIAIRVEQVSKCYQIYDKPQHRLLQGLFRGRRQLYKEFWALRDVSFEVEAGETVGLIGRNGSGKSTLLQIICGTLTPSAGRVRVNGRIAALLELGAGFNPEFTGRENVYLNGSILGLTAADVDARFDAIAAFADIGDFLDQPVKTYSSGMFVRLAFAVQAHIDASVVVIDEALAVGDVFFRQKCYARLERLKQDGAAILLVSHSMPDIEQYCRRAALLDRGGMRFLGPAGQAAKHYYLLHQGERRSDAADAERTPSAAASLDPGPSAAMEPAAATAARRPEPSAFMDVTALTQVSRGLAHCRAVALSNGAGAGCTHFTQGDAAHFYSEFELSGDIGVPVCGVVLKNDRGVIVHGKNSWQYDDDVPAGLGAGTRVACRQEIELRLAPGEYSFEIGLASVTPAQWRERHRLSFEDWAAGHVTECVVTDAGRFSVGLARRDGTFVLTHHGVADLPGRIHTWVAP